MGETGAGTPEHAGVSDRVDIFTGTFGKALGGASGGYVSGRAEIVQLLRQVGRPYLFSNSVAPSIAAAAVRALDLVASAGDLRERLQRNARLFRARMQEEGFDLLEGEHPIIAVMFGDAVTASKVANEMLAHGVYVTAFTYPVVPKGKARIRVQLSAAHSAEDIEVAVRAFVESRAAM
jgi:glycine C-acetyltransferase